MSYHGFGIEMITCTYALKHNIERQATRQLLNMRAPSQQTQFKTKINARDVEIKRTEFAK